MWLVESTSNNPFENLALEEYLLDAVEEFGPLLLFYINQPSIVIGKNQNPWRECDLMAMKKDGVFLARRVSGGGTVFHDLGNLNYSLIIPRNLYNQQKQFSVIIDFLSQLGIQAELVKGNSLICRGRKFSGSAFCLRKNAALHHGTLLLNSDLNRLRQYLQPTFPDIETRAIASVPARVMNLTESLGDLSVKKIVAGLASAFAASYAESLQQLSFTMIDKMKWTQLTQRHQEWDWLYGNTPLFNVSVAGALVTIEKGYASDVDETGRKILSDVSIRIKTESLL